VLSPSEATDQALAAMGIEAARIGRWARGVDTERSTRRCGLAAGCQDG
jgi:hypothetical protein